MYTRCTLGPQSTPTFHRPFLRYAEGEQGDGGAGGDEKNEPPFPANTPVKDMKPEEQAAYWQHQSRKHEDRVKSLGDWTPDKIAALQKERDELRANGLSDADKAIEAAKEEGRAEERAIRHRLEATHALEKALQGRVPTAASLLSLDVSKFIVNGNVDDAAVKAWVDANSDEVPKGTQQRKNPDFGQGNRGDAGGSGKSVAAGRDRYNERRKKSTTTTS